LTPPGFPRFEWVYLTLLLAAFALAIAWRLGWLVGL
jgi:hypothetical protein